MERGPESLPASTFIFFAGGRERILKRVCVKFIFSLNPLPEASFPRSGFGLGSGGSAPLGAEWWKMKQKV